jgi:hypothetical protein
MRRHLVSRLILWFALWLARLLSDRDRGPPPTPRGVGPGP